MPEVSDPEPAPMIGAESLQTDPEPAPMMPLMPQRTPIFEQVSGPTGPPTAPPRPAFTAVRPPQSFTDPAYEQRLEQQQMQIYRQANSVKEAEAAVFSARKMLGVLKADREIRSGTPVDQAMYQNMQFFINPADKGFAGTMKVLRPTPKPYVTNFPGIPAPAVIDPEGRPHWMLQSARPPGPEDTGPVQAVPVLMPDGKPVPGHVAVRSGRANKIISVKDPEQMQALTVPQQQSAITAAATATARLLKQANDTGDAEGIKQYTTDLKGYRKQLDDLRTPHKATAAPAQPSGVMVRRKKDGAQFRYKGDAKDVPPDQFDVLK